MQGEVLGGPAHPPGQRNDRQGREHEDGEAAGMKHEVSDQGDGDEDQQDEQDAFGGR